MIPENPTYAYVGAFADELVHSGVRDACLCPGSRSTPLALCLARHPGVRLWVHLDERSAAFFALGLARGRRAPVALLSTSGTAAANFLPAVVEARYGRVPLVVLTADRPPELRDVGAPQTIDQLGLYGRHAKWFVEAALPGATPELLRYARTLAARAVAAARAAPAGPVHLNFPFREPLVPVPVDIPAAVRERAGDAWAGRAGGRAYARTHEGVRICDPAVVRELAADLVRAPRGLLVCGPQDDPGFPRAAGRLAASLGYPVLADPLSGVRAGGHDRRWVLDAYDPLLRLEGDRAPGPDAVLRFGAAPTSKPLVQYLERHAGRRQVLVDAGGGWRDPTLAASDVIHAQPSAFAEALAAAVEARRPGRGAGGAGDPGAAGGSGGNPGERGALHGGAEWAAAWIGADRRCRDALAGFLSGVDEPFEGKVFSELGTLLPDGATVFAGNSMPVRDLDAFFPGTGRDLRFMANRGANGIDGVVSTALGVAAADPGPVVLVVGDLSFYHDMNGLLAAGRFGISATIVLLNNDGGGIFHFLPQAEYPEHFEALFGTPHGLDFRPAAELYGARFARAERWEAFRNAVGRGLEEGGLSIVEVRTDRVRNAALHREAWRAAAEGLERGGLREAQTWRASG